MNEQGPIVIGSTTTIDLLQFECSNIPAKVDSGADSSAIWASNVYEHEGTLFFTLFGKGSPFYSGKTHQTKDYTASVIKNSFGHTERRYKVRFKVAIAGKVLNAKFTLANREANKYPVLIGRRTMHGRFIIDVSRSDRETGSGVLVLSSKEISSVRRFFKDMQADDPKLNITLATYEDLEFFIGDKGVSIKLSDSRKDLADFGAVYFKTFSLEPDIAASAAYYLERRNVPFFDKAVTQRPPTNKLLQYLLLQESGIPVPDSMYVPARKFASYFKTFKDTLGVPFIVKDIYANKGERNYLIQSQEEFDATAKQAKKEKLTMVAQKFIPNKGDYRLIVVGKKVEIAMLRTSKKGTHLNNTAAEGEAELVDCKVLPQEVTAQAIFGAGLLGFSIAGADFMQDTETGLWYCLEINDAPQLASGAFVEKKREVLAKFLRKKAKIN